MSISQSVQINRPATDIFAIYRDVESWPVWDPDIEGAGLDGPFEPGTKGWIKPVGAPKSKTVLTVIESPARLVVESPLPLCRMVFDHQLQETNGVTTVTHEVSFSGPLGWLFSLIISPKLKAGFDGTMQGLKAFAENP